MSFFMPLLRNVILLVQLTLETQALFTLTFINDIDLTAEGVEGAITGSSTVWVTHMLCADDLCLTANRPDQLQTMPCSAQSFGRVCQEERVNHQYR